ncbi:MAG TPA: preprotein translocase subunit SecY, partial [Tepidisphaeraceae bacterium]|nr:preprotein translocase subunit SecY [Tepidisphaeraceae bacterium]
TFANCFKIPELKSRIIFTVLLLGICRIMAWITIPGLDGGSLMRYFDAHAKDIGGSLLGMYSLFTGGAMQHCAVASLGIMPYITATIIVQLLTAVVPQLSKLAREEGGRAKLIQIGRVLTLVLCLGHGTLMTLGWENPTKIFPQFTGQLVLIQNLWWYRIQTILILTTGTLLLMWLGEQISERGIGNGVSLVITIGIVADLPGAFQAVYYMFNPPAGAEKQFHLFPGAPLLVLLLLAVIAGVIAVTQAQRKIPVQYAQRMVGRKLYGGQSSFMPLRVNYAGVMPIIFAQAILMFPSKICYMLGNLKNMKFFDEIGRQLDQGHLVYYVLYSLMILFFSYFWVATQFNEIQIADDLKKHGGYIPGVRPGQATSEYLHRAMSRITLAGAIFLTMIAVIPTLLGQWFNVDPRVTRFFGGTSILITVGVLLDTMRQMESHLLMRHYDGFLKKGRLRGRL